MSKKRVFTALLLALPLALLVLADPVWAAKAKHATPEWRVIWTQVWKIINFLILVFLMVKIGRKPLKEFFASQKTSMAETIQAMEQAKAEAEAELKATEALTAGLEQELEKIESFLAESAARERAKMIEDAQREAEMIMQRAEIMGARALVEARTQLANEMIELAGRLAEETLRRLVNDSDRTRFFEKFTRDLAKVDLAAQG